MTSDAVKKTEVPDDFRERPEGASNKQLKFLKSLMDERVMDEDAHKLMSERWTAQDAANAEHGEGSFVKNGISKRRASGFIERLLEKPRKPVGDKHKGKTIGMPPAEALPPGRYAILVGEEGVDQNDWYFYHVKRGTKSNYVWIKRMSSDDEYELPFPEALKIARQIVDAGADKAAMEYGERFKRCSRCNRGLTRRISRKLKVGPVCGGHWYQDWDERVAIARAELQAEGFDPDENIEEDK